VGHSGGLDELRPVPDDGYDPHDGGQKAATDMSSLTNSIRGTVQGVVAAASHVAWWLSWHLNDTGAVRPAPERPTS